MKFEKCQLFCTVNNDKLGSIETGVSLKAVGNLIYVTYQADEKFLSILNFVIGNVNLTERTILRYLEYNLTKILCSLILYPAVYLRDRVELQLTLFYTSKKILFHFI